MTNAEMTTKTTSETTPETTSFTDEDISEETFHQKALRFLRELPMNDVREPYDDLIYFTMVAMMQRTFNIVELFSLSRWKQKFAPNTTVEQALVRMASEVFGVRDAIMHDVESYLKTTFILDDAIRRKVMDAVETKLWYMFQHSMWWPNKTNTLHEALCLLVNAEGILVNEGFDAYLRRVVQYVSNASMLLIIEHISEPRPLKYFCEKNEDVILTLNKCGWEKICV